MSDRLNDSLTRSVNIQGIEGKLQKKSILSIREGQRMKGCREQERVEERQEVVSEECVFPGQVILGRGCFILGYPVMLRYLR